MNKTAQPMKLNGHPITASIPQATDVTGIRLSDRTAAMLDSVAVQLMREEVAVWQLPSPLQCVYHAGVHHGQQQVTAPLWEALAAAEYDRDRYYEHLHNPGRDFTDLMQRRIDQASIRWEHVPEGREFFARVLEEATAPRTAGGAR